MAYTFLQSHRPWWDSPWPQRTYHQLLIWWTSTPRSPGEEEYLMWHLRWDLVFMQCHGQRQILWVSQNSVCFHLQAISSGYQQILANISFCQCGSGGKLLDLYLVGTDCTWECIISKSGEKKSLPSKISNTSEVLPAKSIFAMPAALHLGWQQRKSAEGLIFL